MADDNAASAPATNAKAAKAAAATAGADTTTTTPEAASPATPVERKFVPSTDLTTTRALQIFTTYGRKGSMTYHAGMEVPASDIADYFPDASAYASRVHNGFIGLPNLSR